jgi:FMN phosphatase YigB (HAD superfamily)
MTTLFFDIGNVLVTFDFSKAMRELARDCPHQPEELESSLRPLITAMEDGQLASSDFIEQARARIGYRASDDAFVAAYCNIFEENRPMVERVTQLADRAPLYLLSNTSGLHLDYLRAAYPVFAHFRGGAFSHLSASSKPEPKIYQDLITLSGCDPARTLYLDDAPANTAAGARHGLQVFTYDWKNHAAFEAELARLGLT